MLFLGRSTPETYGALTNWISNADAKAWLEMRNGFLPGQGLIILEIQQKILHFLVQCCFLIFQDLPVSSLIDESAPSQPEPAFLPIADGSLPSLETIVAEAPYRVPAHLDAKRLLHMVLAKRSAAEDHIWTLREDPGYFADAVKAYDDHRTERLLDTKGKVHRNLNRPIFWNRVLEYTLARSYLNFEIWDVIYKQLVSLVCLTDKYAGTLSVSENLPAELEDAFQAYMFLINQASKTVVKRLSTYVPTSPTIRSSYHRYGPNPGQTIVAVELKTHISLQDDRFLWLYHHIINAKRSRDIGLSPLMDELERLIRQDAKQKERVTPLIAQTLLDLAVIAEIVR